eukprot:14811226-Alexandrium_andersonii.AAC.2
MLCGADALTGQSPPLATQGRHPCGRDCEPGVGGLYRRPLADELPSELLLDRQPRHDLDPALRGEEDRLRVR